MANRSRSADAKTELAATKVTAEIHKRLVAEAKARGLSKAGLVGLFIEEGLAHGATRDDALIEAVQVLLGRDKERLEQLRLLGRSTKDGLDAVISKIESEFRDRDFRQTQMEARLAALSKMIAEMVELQHMAGGGDQVATSVQ